MFKQRIFAAGLLAATISSAHALPYGFYDARSVAMGNVSVATGGITTAAFSNPGMLSVNETNDSFSLLLPAIGVQAIDDGNVIDLVDEYQELENNQTPENIARQVDILNELDDASAIVAGIVNAAMVYSGDSFTWGVTVRGDAVASAGLTNVDTNPVDPTANVTALGVLITEIGIPVGTDISVAGMQLSVGVTPKLVQLEAIEYNVSIENSDIEDIGDQDSEDLGSFTTLDAGVTLNVIDTFRIGLVAKNLIEETKYTSIGREINIDTHLRAGVAFDAGFMTLAADMDLTERDPVASENPSKSLSIGAELNTFEVFQLRAGYQTNMASGATDPDLLSLGVGFWLGFHLDAAVVVGDDSSFGAFVQTGFRF